MHAKTVVLENASRALTGKCRDCNSEVYRILSPAKNAALQALTTEAPAPAVAATVVALAPKP
jgi:hypothetical protein